MKKILPLFLVLLGLVFSFNAIAQPKNAVNYLATNKKLNNIEMALANGDLDSDEINEKTAYLGELEIRLNYAQKRYEKELVYIQKKIDSLGEAPKKGVTEAQIIAKKRKEFARELEAQKAKIAEVVLLGTRSDQIEDRLFNLRNKVILGNVLERQAPLIYPHNLYDSSKLFISFVFDIIQSPVKWYNTLKIEDVHNVNSHLVTILFIAFLSLWIGVRLRLLIMRKFGYQKENEHPRYNKKIVAAVFVAIAYGVIPASIIGGFLLWILSSKVFGIGFLGDVLNQSLYFLLYIVLANAVSRVIFAPNNEKWRLINVSNEKAKRVTKGLYFSIWAVGISALLKSIAQDSNYTIELVSFLSTLSDIAKSIAIVMVVKRFLWDDIDSKYDEEEADEESEEHEANNAFRITLFFTLFSFSMFVLSMFGYPFLAAYILNKFLLSFLIVGLLFILNKAFREILQRVLLLRFWVKTFKLRRKIVSKLNFWISLVVDPLFVVLGIFAILALWGVSTDFLKQMFIKLFMGFTIGGVEISLVSIVFGIAVFFVGISIVRTLKRRLMGNILSKMDIDEGIRHSLASGFGFFGFVVSTLLAIAIMGGDLTNFALIAGALSFGIGLGLQNIVNNFVSGIILLFERPIKVGDWVFVNGEEGIVKQINIRATELKTWKKASIIIPNADLLSNTVKNLTHGDTWGRLDIKVGVAYGSDTKRVSEVLLECVEHNKKILKKPVPYVLFLNFGDSSLDFELRCYTNDVMNNFVISSEIRFEIDRRFREENIEIPFPQRTLHIGDSVTRESLNASLKASVKKVSKVSKVGKGTKSAK